MQLSNTKLPCGGVRFIEKVLAYRLPSSDASQIYVDVDTYIVKNSEDADIEKHRAQYKVESMFVQKSFFEEHHPRFVSAITTGKLMGLTADEILASCGGHIPGNKKDVDDSLRPTCSLLLPTFQ